MSSFEILGTKNYVSFITNVQIQNWGRTVRVDCVYDPEQTKTYSLFFLGCEDIRWVFNENEIDCLEEDVLDVLDFQIKEKSDRNEIALYAYVIELYLNCKDIKVDQNW